ncbi:MAG: septum site-determining protein MinC [Hydrogenibacillus schlegelii]|nr:septum site-determining protein MinC [Hydrogenibacillus schlegelii]
MAARAPRLHIKGTRDGLVFYFDPNASVEELLAALEERLTEGIDRLAERGGPTPVILHFGTRYVPEEVLAAILEAFRSRPTLAVREVVRDVYRKDEVEQMLRRARMRTEVGIIRSGELVESEGDILVLGDVNPGGVVRAGGNIFVFGQLAGVAHAGCGGRSRLIVAHDFRATHLSIGGVHAEAVPPEHYGRGAFVRLEGEALRFYPIRALRTLDLGAPV